MSVIKSTGGFLLFFVLSMPTPTLAGQCDIRMTLFNDANRACKESGKYCEDVPLYRQDAVQSCGLSAVSKSDGDNLSGDGDGSSAPSEGKPENDKNRGITALTEEMPEPDKVLPRSCAYFTKPAYQPVRLNYHQVGAMVCYNESTYICEGDGGGKEWVKRGNCSQRGRDLPQACAVEGTCN